MTEKVLLTSFQTWLKHQKSNSSDDLLGKINASKVYSDELDYFFFLRQLPVDIEQAAVRVIDAIEVIRPQTIICCGMAESRSRLSLESNAWCRREQIYTTVNLDKLIDRLNYTYLSHDAGKFVCEGLYYRVLSYIRQKKYCINCVFAHVPILETHKIDPLEQDFDLIIRYLQHNS